jgi:hypothetical protein
VNVSGTGLLVRDPLGLAPGTALRVDLELDAGGPPVRVDGTVVRAGGRGEVAVQFEPVSREDRDRLARFISAANRAERRTRRTR